MDGWSAPRPGRFTPEKNPVPIVQEAGWATGSVWTSAEILASTRIRSPDRPARNESLYRLRYPGARFPGSFHIYRSKVKCQSSKEKFSWRWLTEIQDVTLVLDSSWNVMAHCDAREGKGRGNWRMEWVASTLPLPRNTVYPALLLLMLTPRLPVVDWTDAPADLNGLVRFAERRNLVPAHVPSHFNWPLLPH